MSITVPGPNIVFKDSLNFFPMPLSKLPKSFGIRQLCKGYFPHFFNTKANENYRGELPAAEFFDPEGMSEDGKDRFMDWHAAEKEKGLTWDLQEELLKYCVRDVDILRRCCMKFRDMFMRVTKKKEDDPGVDPLDKPLTIAAACNLVLRRNFLQPNTIAIIPPHAYGPNQNFSLDSIRWLNHVSLEDDIEIQHAMNGGEVRLNGRVTVDGFCSEKRRIYSYHGCLFHGCPDCYDGDTLNPISKKPMAELYRITLFRKQQLEINYRGYEIIEIWEHEWKEIWKDLPADVKLQIEVPAHFEPLNPRESLYGGRTEATKLFHQVKDGEVIRYLDFTSLYPWCNKYRPYIVGHPKIYTNNFKDISSYFGLIRCTVLPPGWLFHPVLPARCHGKLMFALCGTCMEEKRQAYCRHSDKARTIRGTWVTLEVEKAVKMGYVIDNIEVVWDWEQRAEYDKATKTGGRFTEYIDQFLQLKQEASGYPDWCETPEDKERYVEEYFENEGIRLDSENIEKNPGMRSLAKLCLNSMWGKFAQRSSMSQTVILDDPSEVYKLLTSDSVTVDNIRLINDEVIEVTYREDGDFARINPNTNVVIAAFTTCHARLKLYEVLEKYFTRTNSSEYHRILRDAAHGYNASYHRSIKRSPVSVNKDNESAVWKTLYGKYKRSRKPKKQNLFEAGDLVRISVEKLPFRKGYLPQWSEELFVMAKRIDRRVPVYVLKDFNDEEIEGTFYGREIQKVTKDKDGLFKVEKVIRKRKRQGVTEYFVKWLGWPDKFNSWVVDLEDSV
ncbi:uncharacterized protein [Amphiura filiformis]|uniref:uncharacterized protein n=1 Tax=Amphiura filiformis TaxID=82378 RepID=UPI003B20EC4F